MGKKYNYYDTPDNHPETKKYRNWETAILIFGIGVVTTLLILSHLFGDATSSTPQSALEFNETRPVNTRTNETPACERVNMIHVQQRDRLIQLLSLASDLPIEAVLVNEVGTVCYDQYGDPDYDVTTDMVVTVGFTPAAKLNDYRALGDHVSTLLPAMLQIHSEQPRDVVIRFLVGDTYLEWSHSYDKTALYTKHLRGEALWFWTEPEF